MDVLPFVVATRLDRVRAENQIEFVALRVLVGPLPDGIEHAAMDLAGFLAEPWVVKGAQNVFNDLGDWDAWVLPCEENTSARY